MLGIDANDLKGLEFLLKRLSCNSQDHEERGLWKYDKVYTHKEVRAYGRGLLLLIPSFNLPAEVEVKLKVLIGCMSAKGLPLYDRAFFAKEALEVIREYEDSNRVTPVHSVERDWNQPIPALSNGCDANNSDHF